MNKKKHSVDFMSYVLDEITMLRDGFVRTLPIKTDPGAGMARSDDSPIWPNPVYVGYKAIPGYIDQRIWCVADGQHSVVHTKTAHPTNRHIVNRFARSKYFAFDIFFFRRQRWRYFKWGNGKPIFGIMPNGNIFDAGDHCARPESFSPELALRIKMHLGAAATVNTRWTVEIGVDGRSILLVTDPRGLLAAMALRDVPEGKKRRDALLHWVSSHWRKNQTGEPNIHVREHKRGKRKFQLIGPIWCKVDDIEMTN